MSLAFDNEPGLVLVIELMAEDLLLFESIIFRVTKYNRREKDVVCAVSGGRLSLVGLLSHAKLHTAFMTLLYAD